MKQDKLQSAIESILFADGEPVKKSKLAKILAVKNEQVEEALKLLGEKYSADDCGLSLIEKGEEIQLVTKAENAQYVEQIVKGELQETLSNAALEVVSIVAYRGPISTGEIEAIRGVNCSYTLRNLLLRGLIERSDNPRDGRGYVYSITFDFLKKLGAEGVEKLPDYDILSKDTRADVRSDEKPVEEVSEKQ